MASTDVKDVSVTVESTVNRADSPHEGIVNAEEEGESIQEESSADVNQGNVKAYLSGAENTQNDHEEAHGCSIDWPKDEATLRKQLQEQFSHTCTRGCKNESNCKKVPCKMVLLILNVIFATIQLVLFANERSNFATFLNRNNIALKHLLLKDWSKDYETMPYPPTTGMYGVYNIKDLEDHVQYIVEGIYSLPTAAVGSFFLNNHNGSTPIRICATYFESGVFNRTSYPSVVTVHRTRTTQCRNVENNTENYGLEPSLKDLIKSENGVLVRLLELTLDFNISSIHVDMRREEKPPECFEIIGRVTFDNYEINGQIPVILTTSINGFECQGDSERDATVHIILLVALSLTSLVSIIASILSGFQSVILWQKVRIFFKKRSKDDKSNTYKPLSRRGTWEVLKFRDVMMTISCLLTIVGSFLKISYDVGNLTSPDKLDWCGIMLGTGCLLLLMLSLHYLAFDKMFSLLLNVLDRSASSIMRFLLCIGIMYVGFALCGWAVLGPHNIKFLSFGATFQCLLALMNGDEVYVTMTAVDEESQLAYAFNTIFVTFFIFLFTIITLNVFIAIYNTTYEDIMEKKNKSDLMKFVDKDDHTLDVNERKCCCGASVPCCK
ncbi:mucolipin-3-like [Mizuhopecten yessoensis]|uniref:mucolipin-3-like n=1 Tax=Mizuhopecten yessoensis TaxID=6573 RepID=UPI000B45D0CF|nr:mucolipin-3-like [Mizuhopecten yessoensis]